MSKKAKKVKLRRVAGLAAIFISLGVFMALLFPGFSIFLAIVSFGFGFYMLFF